MVIAAMKLKRHLLLGRKVMTKLNSILKSRDITLPTKVRLVKAMVFPVVMYGCESWTAKKAEHRRIDAFELWCWRRLFFFLPFLYFYFFFNFILCFNFTILYWFCHISTWIRHRYTRVSHPEPSSLLPPHDAWGWCTGEDSWESFRLQGDPTSPS